MDFEDADTATLISKAREGDQESFSKLQKVYAPTLSGCLAVYTSQDDRLDWIAEKAWAEIQRGIGSYDFSRGEFSSFVENRARLALLKYRSTPKLRKPEIIDRLTAELCRHPYPFEPDEEVEELLLVIRAQRGDPEAFNELWAANQEPLYGYIRWQIRVGEREKIAQDILGGLCLFLRQKISIYDPNRSRFRTFAKLYADSFRRRYFRQGREILFAWISDSSSSGSESVLLDIADPEESVEEKMIHYETAKKLLFVTFNLTCPPHQLVVFGFNRLLEWRPAEIVEELSDQLLQDLEGKLENDFIEGMTYDESFIRRCFQRLRKSMELILGAVVRHPKARQAHMDLLNKKVGSLLLGWFYTNPSDREDNVVKWSGNVWKSIRIKMLETELQPTANTCSG